MIEGLFVSIDTHVLLGQEFPLKYQYIWNVIGHLEHKHNIMALSDNVQCNYLETRKKSMVIILFQ